jgi:hypothetical protein
MRCVARRRLDLGRRCGDFPPNLRGRTLDDRRARSAAAHLVGAVATLLGPRVEARPPPRTGGARRRRDRRSDCPGGQFPRIGGSVILLAFVPGLIFESALTLDLDELMRRILPVSLLATAGVALTVLLIGVLTHLTIGLSWANAMLLGAILAATDPIAVISLLRRIKAPAGLAAILEGESLFNDGTGVAVFSAVLFTIVSGAPSFGDATVRFFEITLGGTAVGLAAGFLGLALLRFAEDAPLEILATLVIAYGSYLAADLLHASGIVAVVVAGIVVARYGARIGRLHGPQLLGFWNLLAFVLNAMLFILVGAALPATALLPVAGLVLIAYVIMLVVRAVAPACSPLGRQSHGHGGTPPSGRPARRAVGGACPHRGGRDRADSRVPSPHRSSSSRCSSRAWLMALVMRGLKETRHDRWRWRGSVAMLAVVVRRDLSMIEARAT